MLSMSSTSNISEESENSYFSADYKFDLIMSQSAIFQLCQDRSYIYKSLVEPVLSRDLCVMLKDTKLCQRYLLDL